MELRMRVGLPVVEGRSIDIWHLSGKLRRLYLAEPLGLVIAHLIKRAFAVLCGIPSSSRGIVKAAAGFAGMKKSSADDVVVGML
jgi:hypothetical protein